MSINCNNDDDDGDFFIQNINFLLIFYIALLLIKFRVGEAGRERDIDIRISNYPSNQCLCVILIKYLYSYFCFFFLFGEEGGGV